MNIKGPLTPKILPAGQTLIMPQNIRTKYQMQTTKPKFGLTTYLNVCPGPWKNSGQKNSFHIRPTKTRCERNETQNTSPRAQYWTWPRKLIATPTSLSLSQYRVTARRPWAEPGHGEISRSFEKHSSFLVATILSRKCSERLSSEICSNFCNIFFIIYVVFAGKLINIIYRREMLLIIHDKPISLFNKRPPNIVGSCPVIYDKICQIKQT